MVKKWALLSCRGTELVFCYEIGEKLNVVYWMQQFQFIESDPENKYACKQTIE